MGKRVAVRVTAPVEDGPAVRGPRVFSWPVKVGLMVVLVAGGVGGRGGGGGGAAEAVERLRDLIYLSRAIRSQGTFYSQLVAVGIDALTADKAIKAAPELSADRRVRAEVAKLAEEFGDTPGQRAEEAAVLRRER